MRCPGWNGHVGRVRDARNAYRILVRKSLGNRSVERLKMNWKVTIDGAYGNDSESCPGADCDVSCVGPIM
jgi:hypothetical protein